MPGSVRPVRTFLALFGTVWPCSVLSDPVRPVWPCLALLGPKGGATARRLGGREPFEVDFFHAPPICIMLNAEKFAGGGLPPPPVPPPMLVPVLSGVALFHPARPCTALSGAALIYPLRPRLFGTVRPCLVCTNDVNGYFIVDNALSVFKLYISGQQCENKKTMVLASYYTR